MEKCWAKYTPKVPKPTPIKLASSHILQLLGMTTWGVGAIPLNVQAKLEELALVIWATWAKYAKALKGAWRGHNWKFTSNNMVQRKDIDLLMQYHDSEMIHGQ